MSNNRLQTFLNGRVTVYLGDITEHQVDAIVNAAKSSLLGGGGVDGAIHKAGGPDILAACQELRRTDYPDGLPTGEAVLTTAGDLPAQYVIHTVGPRRFGRGTPDAEALAAAYRNSLALAVENDLHTIAFPAISTGVYRYPKDQAAAVASRAIADFLAEDGTIEEVRLVFFSQGDADTFLENQQFPSAV